MSLSRTKFRDYCLADLRVNWLIEIQLLILTFSTGIQDAISFPDFTCFASNQTGNSVILAVGLTRIGRDLFDISNVGVSLASFVTGAIITGQIAHLVGPRRRLWLFATHFFQSLMIFGAAAIQSAYRVRESGSSALGAMALLAFSSGAQVASMRPFRVQEITTAMATAAWIDLVVDSKLLAIHNHSRDRRALFLISLVAGSFAGAYMHVAIGSSNALFVSAAGKSLVCLTLLCNIEETELEEPSLECGT